eukprot:TRINITY_DN41599_c0_g1_i1.p1 TRINITY_DN41599_c0_g1~~TRINITY_DN41599_c0_g1_i1.p1  ORF type:complete len:277 (+),score=58.37 TRINITY_DN41599_c0_g1_i1:44-832(+)
MSEAKQGAGGSCSPFVPRGQLVCFGDSITQEGCYVSNSGWVALLQERYSRKLDVLNRGYSGYNTTQALHVAVKLNHVVETAPDRRVQLVLIFFGANDAAVPDVSPWQHVPLDSYVKNLTELATHFKDSVGTRVLLLCPPPMSEDMWNAHCKAQGKTEGSRFNDVTKKYAEAAQQAALKLGVPYINLWEEFQSARPSNWKELLSDGLHFTQAGNQLLYNLVAAKIDSEFPELAPSKLVLDAPLWGEFDQYNLETSWTSAPSLH